MKSQIRLSMILALCATTGVVAAESAPVSFMDSLQLMDGESENGSDTQGLSRELTPTEILQVEGDGYGPTVSDLEPSPAPVSPDTIKPLETVSAMDEVGQAETGSQDAEVEPLKSSNKGSVPVLPEMRVSYSDLANASKSAAKVKDEYLQGRERQTERQPAEVVDQDNVQGLRRQLIVTPGVLEVLPISNGGHINRIVTPFEEPLVKTTSSAEISTVGSVIEVSTQDRGTVVIYVSDQDQTPETTFSVALVPKSVPPLDINLKFDTLLTKQLGRQGRFSGKARKWEEQQNYVDALVSIMKPLANQQIPPGYSFTQVQPSERHADLFRCRINGLSIQLQQRLDGHNFKVGVHKVTNMLSVPVEIRETACYRKGVAGVSAYPQVVLRPGETTELYIAQRSNVSAETIDLPERPSVVTRGAPHGSY